MIFLGIPVELTHKPSLDENFMPLGKFNQAFLTTATVPISISLERNDKQISVHHSKIHGTFESKEVDCYYVQRLMKTMLWLYGGYQFSIVGDDFIIEEMKKEFSPTGKYAFDVKFMSNIYEKSFAILKATVVPEKNENAKPIGRHLNGCRIGFDAGGSDRKVSAVKDGEPIFSEEIVWHPKLQSDPDYHYQGIVSALKSAAAHLPQVDAVGISSAGVYIQNKTMSASLFLQVPENLFEDKVKNIYHRAVVDTFGNVPYAVCNDGDVSALAGAMNLNQNNVLGLAMGTSEAVGFVDPQGCITGWLNELAFVPVDASPNAMADEWSGDIGCGVKYFSQDSVIKLAPSAGIHLEDSLSPAEKLKIVQSLMETDDTKAAEIYKSIGVYLGHSLAYYYEFYKFSQVLLLGRVMSGKGGNILLETAQTVLNEEYPELSSFFQLSLPDEKSRRVGQSVAAASLPKF